MCLSLIRECARARMREEKRFNSCIQVIFETLLIRRFRSHWHPDVCLSLIRERARTRMREERAVSSLNCLAMNEIFISRSSCFRLCDCGTLFFQSQREKIFLSL